MNCRISHPNRNINCEIDLPSSKSISNRLLIIQALCKQEFKIHNLSNSEDTKSLKNALNSTSNIINIGAAGTSFRFLTSYLSTRKGEGFTLTGSDRMKERPIKQLAESLRELGAEIEYKEQEFFPPLKINGKNLKGGKVQIDGEVSSQFISALLLIAPSLNDGLELTITGELVSKPYIKMTLSLMQEFGISYSWINNIIKIENQKYIAKDSTVEADWSAASFWFEIAAFTNNCNIKLNGLSENSIQGDKTVMELFEKLGVHSIFEKGTLTLTKNNNFNFPNTLDLLETPDLYQPLKCTLFGLKKSVEFSELDTLKDKETDRVAAVENELLKFNSTNIIKTYKDHRMAMSFAPLCLKFGELQITDMNVVHKSYPNYWNDLEKAGFIIMPLAH
ncbi:MAG: 3-phosphoshikimate 1-carboxyvinyltransferase [Flavobacteriales bacterium]|nr:3-phosphoshikimate 1-carboxyvinyltransferase [Flavobacteriales bacterium]MBT5090542.1 3-phosphoshikimate 1-carboxyvinyltransferase [Flavobacteriales bacterium]MBT5750832.1 3-phosphoshikimate 1-carboxyvinyltransferase [Flavobacteriales bacterium]